MCHVPFRDTHPFSSFIIQHFPVPKNIVLLPLLFQVLDCKKRITQSTAEVMFYCAENILTQMQPAFVEKAELHQMRASVVHQSHDIKTTCTMKYTFK